MERTVNKPRSKPGRRSDRTDPVLKLKSIFFLSIQSKKMPIVCVILCIMLAMLVGILTVYFTAPRPSIKCDFSFKRTMKSSVVASSRPRSVATGDVNNDHYIDFAVANSGTNTIGVFLSQGDGTFTKQRTYFTGSESHPCSLVISDFNNDSYIDIAVANYATNNIGLFLGYGNGTFDEQKVMSLGSSHPLFVTTGDFNKDNRMDLAVVNNGTNSISILLGYGNGSFEHPINYSTGYDSVPSSLAVGDFNNDTHPDIVVANFGTDNIGIFINYGNGTFTNQQIYTTSHNSKPSSVAVGDFNQDNILDVVTANYGSESVGIFFGHGNGTFLSQVLYTIDSKAYRIDAKPYPQYVTASNMNQDNALDIVIVDSENDKIHVLPGYGNGSFGTIETYVGVSGSMPVWISVANLNNNNHSDMVVVNYGTNNILVLIDYFSKPSARQEDYSVGAPDGNSAVAVGDFNDDNIIDIVFGATDQIGILIGLGNSTFNEQGRYPPDGGLVSQYVCTGDVNNDNRTDIVVADPVSNKVVILLGYGNGTFGRMKSYLIGEDSRPYWIALGDLNDDGVLDIVSANLVNQSISIFLENGNDTSPPMVTYFTPANSRLQAVAVININNDKHLDIVVLDANNRVFTFLGQDNATFTMITTNYISTHADSCSFSFGDFNKDNYLDIVIANTFEDNVGVSLGYGNGTFAPQKTYSTGYGSQPYVVIVADCNNDDIFDIIATNLNSDEIIIFYGHGNGSFELSRKFSTGSGSKPYGIVAADLDNDTHLEYIVALWGKGQIAILTEYNAAEFVDKTIYSTDSAPQPISLAIGDFNNDNRSDIVVANSAQDSLMILFASGNGTFDKKTQYFIGADFYPQYVITCDIDKDNQTDIVSVNSKNNSISVIKGYGNGSFAQQLKYSTEDGSSPYAVIAGDINNDNRLDLVVANEGTDSISVLYGYDYRSFQNQQNYSITNGTGPWGIATGDFNNDNITDIVAAIHYGDTWCILFGYENGSFTNPKIHLLPDGSGAWGIDVGDFNNDNQADIVIANYHGRNIGIYLGYGNGSFSDITLYPTGSGSHPVAVALGDFNNDSRLDIVVANTASDNIGVFLGYGNGSFATMMPYSTGQNSYPYAVAVGDFDNNGRMDIAVANYNAGTVGVLLGYGNGTFADQGNSSKCDECAPAWISVGYFDKDSYLDIAVAYHSDDAVGILLGYGNGSFADYTLYSAGTGSLPNCITIGDFNNDNISDIAVANYGIDNIVVLFGSGDGSFLRGSSYSTVEGSVPFAITKGDFNKDGQLDIAVGNWLTNTIGIFLGDNIEPFGNVEKFSSGEGSKPYSVALADFNKDSWIDIAVANYGTHTVGILLGRPNRNFSDVQPHAIENGSAPHSVAVSDFNNDTYLDIVVANSETDNIVILLGDGTGSFTTGSTYSTGPRSRPYQVIISDFNNDNISDIAVANSGTSNILLLHGYGNGTFEDEPRYYLGYNYLPYSVAAGYLNDDAWVDLAIACYGTDHIETLIKMC